MFARAIKEEAAGVYRFSEPMGNRLLNFYGIEETDGWTLIDCGLPNSVSSWIDEGGIKGNIKRLIITHSDADHFGSAAWLRSQYPNLEIICHPADKRLIEDHKAIVRERYDVARSQFGFGYPQEVLEVLLTICGGNFTVDTLIEEGDRLPIKGDDWTVHHLPGHSAGHITLLNQKDGTFIIGDAFLGEGPPDVSGNPSMPPTHDSVTPYLKSIDRAKALKVGCVLSGHWMPMEAAQFRKFLKTSEQVVQRDLDLVQQILTEGEKTFEALLLQLNEKVSTWEASENAHYLYAVHGYLAHLKEQHKIEISPDQRITWL